MCLQYKSIENTAYKQEIAHNKQFLLFPQFFLPACKTSAIFIKFEIVICKLNEFGRVYNLLFTRTVLSQNNRSEWLWH